MNLSTVTVTPVEPERAIERSAAGDLVVLTVRGCLDGAAGAALVKAASDAAVERRPSRIDIDLCSVTGFTPEGARWLLRCKRLSADLRDGLHYRTGRGPGQEALLVAYAEE